MPAETSDAKLAETLEFFQFSFRRGCGYEGNVTFVLTENNETRENTIVVNKEGVRVREGTDENAIVVRMDKKAFLDVYSGALHPRRAVLGGRISVDGMQYMELKRFMSSFDLSSKTWEDFYASKEKQNAPTGSQLWQAWKSMLVVTAHCSAASASLKHSRRCLTQMVIQRVMDGSTPTAAIRGQVHAPVVTQALPMMNNFALASLNPQMRPFLGPGPWRPQHWFQSRASSVSRSILTRLTQRLTLPKPQPACASEALLMCLP